MGLGIRPFTLPGYKFGHWVCESTLRYSSSYKSIVVLPLALFLASSIIVILVSYTLDWFLLLLVSWRSRFGEPLSGGRNYIQDALLSHRLHRLLQLHRIAVEKSYDIEFRGTADTVPQFPGHLEAPLYGVSVRSSDLTEEVNLDGERFATIVSNRDETDVGWQDYHLRNIL